MQEKIRKMEKKTKKKQRSVDDGAKKEPNPTRFLEWMKRRDSNGATMGFCDRHQAMGLVIEEMKFSLVEFSF